MIRTTAISRQLYSPPKAKISPFYLNKAVEAYASKPSTPISLKHLINFGKGAREKDEREEGAKYIKSGEFLRTELPTRLSHRLRDLQSLPFIVAEHPRMVRVYEMYLEAFERLRRREAIKTLEDNDRFCGFMQGMLDQHRVVIPELAIGVAESSPVHFSGSALDIFMTRMLRSRISRRVITEQHIALTSQFRERQRLGKGVSRIDERKVGVVDTKLNAAEVARHCAELLKSRGGVVGTVPVVVEGDTEAVFAYIEDHLEFMLFEIIKHAAHATVDYHGAENAKNHPIRVTVVYGSKDLAVRVSDQGGGLLPWGGLDPLPDPSNPPYLTPNASLPTLTAQRLDIFSFSHMRRLHLHNATSSTPIHQPSHVFPSLPQADGSASSAEAREAIDLTDSQLRSETGLPLAEMFARYFGGSLSYETVRGHGSDAFLMIPRDLMKNFD